MNKILLFIALAVSQAHYGSSEGHLLPDLKFTPGKSAMNDAAQICKVKWGKDERHVTEAMKKQACQSYGATDCPGPKYELDHLISRELGGADDVLNLWPQPHPDAMRKDRLENLLHKELCANRITLPKARACLVKDWWACYKDRIGPE